MKLFYEILGSVLIIIGLTLPSHAITTFEECVTAGHTVIQSHPRHCKTPDGKIFVEKIPEKPKEDFCGWATKGRCSGDLDCIKGGCSGQVCQSKKEEPVITTCEWRDCYSAEAYDVQCKCIDDHCQWQKKP